MMPLSFSLLLLRLHNIYILFYLVVSYKSQAPFTLLFVLFSFSLSDWVISNDLYLSLLILFFFWFDQVCYRSSFFIFHFGHVLFSSRISFWFVGFFFLFCFGFCFLVDFFALSMYWFPDFIQLSIHVLLCSLSCFKIILNSYQAVYRSPFLQGQLLRLFFFFLWWCHASPILGFLQSFFEN